MLKVAICDDDVHYIRYIKEILIQIGLDEESVKYYEYTSGEEFIRSFRNNIEYSLLILDMQMPKIDGNQVAIEFRKKYKDAILVLCSDVYRPTPESFKVNPFRYLLKNYDTATMVDELKEVVQYLRKNEGYPIIIAKYQKKNIKIKLDDILYISILKRGSCVHTCIENFGTDDTGCFVCDKKVSELYQELSDYGFAYAHNSYIVNLKHVKIKGKGEIKLSNGEILSVARSKEQGFREKMAEFLSSK